MSTAIVKGCSHADCDVRKIRRVDLFCHTHQRFLPLAGLPGWMGATILLSCGILLGFLVLLAARTGNAVPVFVAASGVGLALLALPLRSYGAIPIVVGLAWAGMCAAVLVSFDGQGARLHATFALALIVLTAVAFVVQAVVDIFGGGTGHRRTRLVAGTLSATLLVLSLGAFSVWAVANDPPDGAFTALPDGLSSALPMIGVVSAALAGLVVVAIAALAGFLSVLGDDEWLVPAPSRFRRVPRPAAPATSTIRGRDPLSQITHAVARFAAVTVFAMLTALALAATMLLRFVHAAVVFLIGVVNWLLQLVVAAATYLHEAVVLLFRAVRAALRLTVVPVVGLAVAAIGTARFSTTASAYLVDGDLAGVFTMAEWVVAAVLALTVAWIALSGLGLAAAAGSALTSIVPLLAWSLIFAAIGGWALWLLGPPQLGPITLGSTVLLAVITAVGLFRRRGVEVGTA